MRKQAIKDEAQKLMTEFGPEAYGKAREAMREARRRKNVRLERYFAKVAVEIAVSTGRDVGAVPRPGTSLKAGTVRPI